MVMRKVLIIIATMFIMMSIFALPVFANDTEKEPNNTQATASVLRLNQPLTGTTKSNSNNKDVDWYKVNIIKTGICNFNFLLDNKETASTIKEGWNVTYYDTNGNKIRKYTHYKHSFTFGEIALDPGQYFIQVEPYATNTAQRPTCNYMLSVIFDEDDNWITDSMTDETSKTIKENIYYYGTIFKVNDNDTFIYPVTKDKQTTICFNIDSTDNPTLIKNGWKIQVFDEKDVLLTELKSIKENKQTKSVVTDTGSLKIKVTAQESSDKNLIPVDCVYAIKAVSSDYVKKTYTITYKDSLDGTILETQTIEEGDELVPPIPAEHYGYDFSDWEKDDLGSENIIMLAKYKKHVYIVTFRDGLTGKTIKTKKVKYKKSAKAPKVPTHNGYEFIEWDNDYSKIKSDTVITALYKEKNSAKNTPVAIYIDKIKIKGSKPFTIKKGKTKRIKVVFTPSYTNNKQVTYKSSNTKVATVSKKGKIKALSEGKCTITVTTVNGKKKAKVKVIVE